MKHIVIDARIRRASTGRYVDRLIEHLQKIDTKNRYSILIQPDDPWKPTNPNFTASASPFNQFSFNPLEQINFSRHLYKLKADLVHFPLNQQPIFYFRPVVTSTLDLTMLRFSRPGKTPLPIFWLKMLGYRFLFWYSNLKSKAIITISNFVKNDLENNYRFTKGKITNTYCASEPPLKQPAIKPKFSIDSNFILYVGTAFPHKNLITLINALPGVIEKNPNIKLVLVGKTEQYYQKIIQLTDGLPYKDHIIIPGFVEDRTLKWLYQKCSAYVFPSLSEGFGLPGLEAMAHGAPVVSSNATCLPEIYGDAALFFNPNSKEDIADKVNQVLEDKALSAELIQKGYNQIKKYSWERMAKETLSVYCKVLDL